MNNPKVLIFFSYKSHKLGYIEKLFERLSNKSNRYGLDLYRGALKELQISVKNDKLKIRETLTDQFLDTYDDVYFELWYKAPQQALAAAIYLTRRKKRFFSREILKIMPSTKVGEIAVLADNGLPLPDTFTSSHKQIKKMFARISTRPFDYPFIMKAADGYGGKNNYLVRSYKHLKEVLNQNEDTTFICQTFIPNDYDFRCVVFGGKVSLVIKRTRDNSKTHLNNTSQGAEGAVVSTTTLSQKIIRDVERAAKLLDRSEFSGVDVLISSQTGQHYILEVNQTPQIEIGAAIDQKMDALLTYIKERVI